MNGKNYISFNETKTVIQLNKHAEMTVINTIPIDELRESQNTYLAKPKITRIEKARRYKARETNDIKHSVKVQRSLTKDRKKIKYQRRAKKRAQEKLEIAFFADNAKHKLNCMKK